MLRNLGQLLEPLARRIREFARHGLDRSGRDHQLSRLMRIATVIGNRPQFVKAAAVSRPLREHHEELIVNTGRAGERIRAVKGVIGS